jgi:choice-of-anchor B domain-containing protein
VIMGKTNGSALFRITDPTDPVFLGQIPNNSPGQLQWHDIKVYKDHAFIVSESVAHGINVFDLTRLRGVTEPQTWQPDTNYPTAFSAHNIAINEETGFAYLVGGNNGLVAPDQCLSGLHMVDIRNPKLPVFAGCHAMGEGPGTAGGLVGAEGVASATSTTPSASSTAARTPTTTARSCASTAARTTCRSST